MNDDRILNALWDILEELKKQTAILQSLSGAQLTSRYDDATDTSKQKMTEMDRICFFCGHDINEHGFTRSPFGQSVRKCYHVNCAYNDCGIERQRNWSVRND